MQGSVIGLVLTIMADENISTGSSISHSRPSYYRQDMGGSLERARDFLRAYS